jgi:hypothetical protein
MTNPTPETGSKVSEVKVEVTNINRTAGLLLSTLLIPFAVLFSVTYLISNTLTGRKNAPRITGISYPAASAKTGTASLPQALTASVNSVEWESPPLL